MTKALCKRLISAVYPNICPFCGKIIAWDGNWCEDCFARLPFISGELSPPENVSGLYACCYYTRCARKAVHMMKFGGRVYPTEAFARLIWERFGEILCAADVLVPVPSSSESVMRRGFAPADKIAKRLSRLCRVPTEKPLKAREGKLDQKGLDAAGRTENANKSFFLCRKADVRGRTIVLVDDVCTTGSTLSACAKILLDAGAKEVFAAVFAKTKKYK